MPDEEALGAPDVLGVIKQFWAAFDSWSGTWVDTPGVHSPAALLGLLLIEPDTSRAYGLCIEAALVVLSAAASLSRCDLLHHLAHFA